MRNINKKLYIACVSSGLKMYEIAKHVGMSQSRLSKILHKTLKSRKEERQKLSRLLRVSQKHLF